jgi:aminopeptidase N
MLRRRMGDQNFFNFLHEVCRRYRLQTITTEQFRELAQQFMPPSPDQNLKIFFENWVYGTGVPRVTLTYTWRAMKLTGTLSQSDVDDSFTAFVPVEVQTGKQKSVHWLATAGDPSSFSIPLTAPPSKVSILTADCLVRTSK